MGRPGRRQCFCMTSILKIVVIIEMISHFYFFKLITQSPVICDAFRYYSQQWKTWAAYFIQVAWRRHYRRKLEKSLREAEEYALAKEGGSSPSFGATIYVSRFAANALRNLRQNSPRNARIPPRSPLLSLQKPTEPDFLSEGD